MEDHLAATDESLTLEAAGVDAMQNPLAKASEVVVRTRECAAPTAEVRATRAYELAASRLLSIREGVRSFQAVLHHVVVCS